MYITRGHNMISNGRSFQLNQKHPLALKVINIIRHQGIGLYHLHIPTYSLLVNIEISLEKVRQQLPPNAIWRYHLS